MLRIEVRQPIHVQDKIHQTIQSNRRLSMRKITKHRIIAVRWVPHSILIETNNPIRDALFEKILYTESDKTIYRPRYPCRAQYE